MEATLGVYRLSSVHTTDIGAVMEYGPTISMPNGTTVIIPPRPYLHPVMMQDQTQIIDLYREAIRSAVR